jgi:hypothetical protein
MPAVNRVQQQRESESSMSTRGTQMLHQTVEEYPMAVVLTAFGLGVAIGAALGAAIGESAPSRAEHMATRIGRRMLDTLSEYVPVSEYLPSSLRG